MKTLSHIIIAPLVIMLLAGQTNAETLNSVWADGYTNSGLLAQNRALLRAADEDVVIALAALRPIVEWRGEVDAENSVLTDDVSLTAAPTLSTEVTLLDGGAN
ncbi:hypothetical protein [Phaeobacter inhibens]|nr:hypothetical protein [Phaeobacter inhibens]UWR47023.1 hypothetical protein K4F86_18525 [Phaeobacter inhibens]